MKHRSFALALSVLGAALFATGSRPRLLPPTLLAFGLRMTARRRWKSKMWAWNLQQGRLAEELEGLTGQAPP